MPTSQDARQIMSLLIVQKSISSHNKTAGALIRAIGPEARFYASAKSMLISIAAAEWVSAPMEIRSTPLRAAPRTVSKV